MNPVETHEFAPEIKITAKVASSNMPPLAQTEPKTLSPEAVIIKLMSLAPDYPRFGIKSLAIFGSVARDEARLDSDVDILVEFSEPPTFRSYMKLKSHLEELLEREVDLADIDMLRPEVIHNIMEDAIPIDLVYFN